MIFRRAACLTAAVAMLAGLPAMAQNTAPTAPKLKPAQAPGVEVERVTKLMVGDRAPELEISEWVKGDEVTGFEEGKVYVVEFWATWCGPCIAGMPHVSKIQKEYKDKGVTVIGVNIWDDPANVAPFMTDKGGDEKMEYTVAIEEKIKGENDRQGKMSANWMRAAGQNGIPSAFIVDQSGYIAWIGHPMRMDEPLEQVVAGEWDIAAAARDFADVSKRKAEEAKQAEAVNKIMKPIAAAFDAGDHDKAYKGMAKAFESKAIWDNPQILNFLAWKVVDPDADIERRDAGLAVKAAERAAELTEFESAPILDTLAWSYYFAGDKAKAVKTQMKAIGLLSGDEKAQYIKSLERMKK